jgi:aspartate/methionine/tyrosine aminotransferase
MQVVAPHFPSPKPIIAAGIAALQQGRTHYTAAVGLPELRQAISDYYQQRFQIEVDPARIVVTPGASGALQLVLGVLINPGDKVLMPDPGYPCNRHMVRMYGGEAVSLGTKATQGFSLANDQVLRHWDQRTKALMVATPANPTGRLLDMKRLGFLYQTVRAPNGVLIVDEIYQGLVYEQPSETALALGQDNLFVVNSFSKFFGMTGWRLGWVVAPPEYVEALDRLAQNLFLAPPTVAQYAALAAFSADTQEILEQRRQVFQERRDYLYSALKSLGFRLQDKPEGAFYLYADISAFSRDSFEFSRKLLQEVAVAITPGKDFGEYRTGKFVRFAYTTDMSRLKLGIERIRDFLNQVF